mmetsp:Transcript_3576/g.13809  ORF Transcript_3576/g.13809 Transcript_3576/m.13809 type:complete len:209 (+) Transcript_3576:1506-2132(+)
MLVPPNFSSACQTPGNATETEPCHFSSLVSERKAEPTALISSRAPSSNGAVMSSDSSSPVRTFTIAALTMPPLAYAPRIALGPSAYTDSNEVSSSAPRASSSTSMSAIPRHSSPSAHDAFSPRISIPTRPSAITPAPIAPPIFNRLLEINLYSTLAARLMAGIVASFTAQPMPTSANSASIAGNPRSGSLLSRFSTCIVSIASANVTP